ncbi:bifunctional 2',3'-cyclic-nucleotide 2'-phosphodiesterase/3'-nucleotidase [Paenibacillus guangzhouensis]|uniref:bifunctional 2',3'-cyclic-nucleotide 2'-phosphodiesterase/3'-nucleotidase n=1 Tax=Paenibacillus guangzhouensis TaxID=1473112 RepID=UPI001266C49B|nr:bifunctional 2',3'-cyclic-nucleotide 2'-phosphodiesterase/3'-nucleotidase [Paenibacillus guangzhouensis]
MDNMRREPLITLRILETTDVHANLMDYDYYRDVQTSEIGLVRTASLVHEARAEVANTLLVDNGDLIQGTPLGTYFAKSRPADLHAMHPVYAVMNAMKYDAATLGNHEFNYGLEYLEQVMENANFPYVNANVYVGEGEARKNKFQPYILLHKPCKDQFGVEHELTIGLLGLVTPQIMEWDKANLEGKVTVDDIVQTAEKFVPRMRAEGADVVVALAHTGFDGADRGAVGAENKVLSLSQVPGIDAITFSHTHKVFPTRDLQSLDLSFKDPQGNPLPAINWEKGTIHGVAAVQSGYGGAELGVIDLDLARADGRWTVIDSRAHNRSIFDRKDGKPLVDPDAELVELITAAHQATVDYANAPIGMSSGPIYSYFAFVQDDPSIQIVTNAQTWYAKRYIAANRPQDKDVPILSVGSPFKAGRNGPSEYTDIDAGPIAIKSASDLYLYDNLLKAVKVTGAVVREWLEMSAGAYHQIDPSNPEEQPLLNPLFSVYNFDIIDGITYEIDVTQPAKYHPDGTIRDVYACRIINLKVNGEPIGLEDEFIVVSNNYRIYGGGNFPGLAEAEVVIDSAEENKQVLMDYLMQERHLDPRADHNWRIAPIDAPVNITFRSAPAAVKYLEDNTRIHDTGRMDDQGFGIFTLDLR